MVNGPSAETTLRDAAVAVMTNRVRITDLRRALDAVDAKKMHGDSVQGIVAQVEIKKRWLPDSEVPQLLVDLLGSELLAERPVRAALLANATDPQLQELLEAGDLRVRGGRRAKAMALARKRWWPGRYWARTFCRILDLPEGLAGTQTEPTEPDSVNVVPFKPLEPLVEFQVDVRNKIDRTLTAGPGRNRAIVAMPTGSGKTRTTVEALLEWHRATGRRNLIVWIAHSAELCEQAVQAFREVWTDLGHRPDPDPERHDLTIWRLWNDRDTLPDHAGVVVASVQKLHAIVRDEDHDLHEQLPSVTSLIGVVVVDEAHRAWARSYREVLKALGVRTNSDRTETPLLGLTATPMRAAESETKQLQNRFYSRLLSPSAPRGMTVTAQLRSIGVLSSVETELLEYTDEPIILAETERYADYYETFEDLHPDLLRTIGAGRTRNEVLRNRILQIDPDWPTLVFASSVEQARAMSILLRRRGRNAGHVVSDTRPSERRSLIERFRSGDLSVLCNYGVLTTGFDAPKIRAVVVARPTTSEVLYQQMIGRGMRGKEFGGTPETLVIDVADNIRYRKSGEEINITMKRLAGDEL